MDELRAAGISASLKEHLVLLEALEKDVIRRSPEEFYYLSRATFVKDEGLLDRFDQVFSKVFKGIETTYGTQEEDIPLDWLKAVAEKYLSEEEMEKIKALGSWDEIMETLKERLEEQEKRHEGGSKWIGTGGTSPFGHSGYHPEGIRVGGESKNKRAAKVWEKREFQNLDDDVQIGTRNIKVALRRLRKFARSGAADELDLDDTIRSTAKNAGYLDLKMVPERHNAVKVLMFFDVGGSMDGYVRTCEELFSAVRTEFKHLEYFYFHNMLYDFVWNDNSLRFTDKVPTMDIFHRFTSDYRVIMVGDASMGPYEITHSGGSVEYYNEEPGAIWLQRLTNTFDKVIWLNPVKQAHWPYTQSIEMVTQLMDNHMYPLTIHGLEDAMSYLSK